jgi:hypothetical protein
MGSDDSERPLSKESIAAKARRQCPMPLKLNLPHRDLS